MILKGKMESSYMELYKNISNKKNQINNKRKQNSKHQLKKNKSLTYYHFDGQTNYLNKIHINETKDNNKTMTNKNSPLYFYSNYEYNDVLLFKAYKKSVSELFKALKIYLNKEIYKYEKIKKEFNNNIHKYYDEEKKKEKINKNKSPIKFNIKSYSKKNAKNKKSEEIYISGLNRNNDNKISINNILSKNYNKNTFDKMIKIYKYTNSRKGNELKDNSIKNNTNYLCNNKPRINSNISGTSFVANKKNFNSYKEHKSLFALLKKNKTVIETSPMKKIYNYRNDNLMKKFIKFSKNYSDNKTYINKTCNQSSISGNKIRGDEEKQNKNDSNRLTKNNELISKIKDSLDDNLKHIFNFSYENFLNKESERECN